MGIALLRIDERLIHGQTAYSWSKAYPVDQFVVIDDIVAKDDFQISLIQMAVPNGKSLKVLSTNEAIEYFKKENYPSTMVVVKGPKVLLDLVDAGINIQSINVGGMYFKEDRKQYAKTVYLNDKEIEIFKMLADKGVKLEIRTSPTDHAINLIEKIKG